LPEIIRVKHASHANRVTRRRHPAVFPFNSSDFTDDLDNLFFLFFFPPFFFVSFLSDAGPRRAFFVAEKDGGRRGGLNVKT